MRGFILAALAVVAVAVAPAPAVSQGLEVSEAPAPELKSYARENAIDPSVAGLAKELSEQAQVIADLKDEAAADRVAVNARLEVLEAKVSRIIKILKLKQENGK